MYHGMIQGLVDSACSWSAFKQRAAVGDDRGNCFNVGGQLHQLPLQLYRLLTMFPHTAPAALFALSQECKLPLTHVY